MIIAWSILFGACGSGKKSSRDARREQIRNNAEAKRQELADVVGLDVAPQVHPERLLAALGAAGEALAAGHVLPQRLDRLVQQREICDEEGGSPRRATAVTSKLYFITGWLRSKLTAEWLIMTYEGHYGLLGS